MKLSRKGLNKIHCSYVRECSPDLNQVEFEQSDFEGAVVLAIGQAKLIKEMVNVYLNEHFPDYSQSDSDASDALDSAIWQEEGKQ